MLYFSSPISVIPLRQNMRIIKRYQYTEFFTRKAASTDTMYNVYCFKMKLQKSSMTSASPSSRHGAFSVCGWRNDFLYRG